MNPEEIVPEWAFAGVPRLRHVSVESGIRLIGAEAWQDCRQLRIVKLPATVVGIADNAFRDCKLLNSVLAPGCRDFGYKAFAECCSLQRVYASDGAVNVFNGEAQRCQIANRVGCLLAPPLQKVIGCMQGPCETGETLDNPSMVSVLFVQNWKCRTSTKGTEVPPGHPPLPLSTTRLLGTKSFDSHFHWLSALRMARRGCLVLAHLACRTPGSGRSEQFSFPCDHWHLSTALSIA